MEDTSASMAGRSVVCTLGTFSVPVGVHAVPKSPPALRSSFSGGMKACNRRQKSPSMDRVLPVKGKSLLNEKTIITEHVEVCFLI